MIGIAILVCCCHVREGASVSSNQCNNIVQKGLVNCPVKSANFIDFAADKRPARSLELASSLAASIYYQGRFAEAIEQWQPALIQTNYGEAVYTNGGNLPTAQLVYSLQRVGEVEAASKHLSVLEELFHSAGAAGLKHRWWFYGKTLLAILKNDEPAALGALQQADAKGLERPDVLDEPILDSIRTEPAFEIVPQNVAGRAADNREAVLTLICQNNPVPDHCRPLEATCVDFGP
jgi:tetratricopeptide (TPR) repeat protein